MTVPNDAAAIPPPAPPPARLVVALVPVVAARRARQLVHDVSTDPHALVECVRIARPRPASERSGKSARDSNDEFGEEVTREQQQ